MKKILFLLSILFFQFIFLTGVNAGTAFEYGCRYIRPSDGDNYVLKYRQVGTDYEVIDCTHNGETCGENYEHIVDRDAPFGKSDCLGSIDVVKEGDKVVTRWIGNYQGEYVYGSNWKCLYRLGKKENKDESLINYTDKLYLIDFYNTGYKNYMYMTRGACSNTEEFLDNSVKELVHYGITEVDKLKINDNCIENSYLIQVSENEIADKEKCPIFEVKQNEQGKYEVVKNVAPSGIFPNEGLPSGTGLYFFGRYVEDSYLNNKSTDEFKDITNEISCIDYKSKDSCMNNSDKIACVWQENENAPNGGFCNVDNLLYVSCGGADDIPLQIPGWISLLVNLLKIVTPIILIFISVVSLLKALASSREDEMKKAQSSLISKIIAAVMVFFVITIVQFVISKVAEDDEYQGFTDCLNCFLNNECAEAAYYRTVIAGYDYCTMLKTGQSASCDYLDGLINTETKEETKEEAKEETKEETKEEVKEETKEETKEEVKEETNKNSKAGYYLVGTLNGQDKWSSSDLTEDRRFNCVKNICTLKYYFYIYDEYKYVYFDGTKITYWFKDGEYNKKIEKAGYYDLKIELPS